MSNKSVATYEFSKLPLFVRLDYEMLSNLLRDYFAFQAENSQSAGLFSFLEDRDLRERPSREFLDMKLKDLGVYDVFFGLSDLKKWYLLLSFNDLMSQKGSGYGHINFAYIFGADSAYTYEPRDHMLIPSYSDFNRKIKETTFLLSYDSIDDYDFYKIKTQTTEVPVAFFNRDATTITLYYSADSHFVTSDNAVLVNSAGEEIALGAVQPVLNREMIVQQPCTPSSSSSLWERVSDTNYEVGTVVAVNKSAIVGVNIVAGGNGYKKLDIVVNNLNECVGFVSLTNPAESITGITVFDKRVYDNNVTLSVISETGANAVITPVFVTSAKPGSPKRIKFDSNLPSTNIASENGWVVSLDTADYGVIESSYTARNNGLSTKSCYIQDSDLYQQFSRAIVASESDIEKIPTTFLEWINRPGAVLRLISL